MKIILRILAALAVFAFLVVGARAREGAGTHDRTRVTRSGSTLPLPDWWYPGLDSVVVHYRQWWVAVYEYNWNTDTDPPNLITIDTSITILGEEADTTFYD
jgi:hypothetical protein